MLGDVESYSKGKQSGAAKRKARRARGLSEGNKGSKGRNRRNPNKPTMFIGIDGEGITRADNETQDYVMLVSSTGDSIINRNGLSTSECFQFILDLKRKYPHHHIVGFGFNYDVNMMLRDAPKAQLQELWANREANIIIDDMYTVEWIPSKLFKIRQDVIATVSDVFGFFQSKFVNALEDWEVEDIQGVIERIKEGKEQRNDFKEDDIPSMLRYCQAECLMLVELMNKLNAALIDAELHLHKWIGAGSVAQAMLQKYDVLKHHVPDEALPEKIQEAVLTSYYGGRFQTFQQGYFPTCYNYDLISAYPYEARSLPPLHGTWSEVRKYSPDTEYAVWLCEWDLSNTHPIMPFPYRHKGQIHYPNRGIGWYWQDEVRQAIAMHPSIKVKKGYVFSPAYTKKPFWFIDMVWAKRKAAKAEGKASQKVYKLGMNSLYGKLAQGRGFRGTVPRYRSYVWAGMITSNTRAKLLQYSLGNEDKVISYATDGMFFTEDVGLPTGNELGQLELNPVGDFYQLGNGIYFTSNDKEAAKKLRTRGHNVKEIDFDQLAEGWHEAGPLYSHRYESRRFIGLGVALLLNDFSLWRKWITRPRTVNLSLFPRSCMEQLQIPGVDVENFGDVVRWYPMWSFETMSDKYKPKTDIFSKMGSDDAQRVLEYMEGLDQPYLAI